MLKNKSRFEHSHQVGEALFQYFLFIFYFLELAFSFINSLIFLVLLATPKSKLIAQFGEWNISCQRTLLINYGNKFGNEDGRG